MRWFEATPSRATPKGQTFIFRTASLQNKIPTYPILSRSGHNNTAKLGDLAEVHRCWSVVFGSGVGAAFDSVGVVAGAFDDVRVGAVSAGVKFFKDFDGGGLECGGTVLRGKNPPAW